MGANQSGAAAEPEVDESEEEMAKAVNAVFAEDAVGVHAGIHVTTSSPDGITYYYVIQRRSQMPGTLMYAALTGSWLWRRAQTKTQWRRQVFTLEAFARTTAQPPLCVGLKYAHSDFVLACLNAPKGTLDQNGRPWNLQDDLARFGTMQLRTFARQSDNVIRTLYARLAPLPSDANAPLSHLNELVSIRAQSRAFWVRHRSCGAGTVGAAVADHHRGPLPSKGFFEILLSYAERDGTGVSVTAKNSSNGETPATTMRKLSQLTSVKHEDDAKEQAEDAAIATMLEAKEKWVRSYLPILSHTIASATAERIDNNCVSVIVSYLITTPRPCAVLPPPE